MATPPNKPKKNVPSPNEGKSVYARFIPAEEVASFASWTPGDIERRDYANRPSARPPAAAPAAAAAPAGPPAPPTAQETAAAQRAARQSGYQDGYRDGLAALESFKRSYAMQLSMQIGALLQSHDAQLGALHDEMAAALTQCALALARQVVRSELAQRPEAVADVARQAVDALLLSARHITVRVHPDDLPLVAQGAAEVLAARGARLVDDARLARGGCRVESDVGGVDATVEARWKQCAAAVGSEAAWADDVGAGIGTVQPAPQEVPAVTDGATSPAPPEAGDRAGEARGDAAPTAIAARWRRHLDHLQRNAAEPVPLETHGVLIRVAGLVLEAAGIRVPVGSVCDIFQDDRHAADRRAPPVSAEVVGFSGDRAYLMPTSEVGGLHSGARVVPRAQSVVPLSLAGPRAGQHPWRRGTDRTLHLAVGDGLLGRVVDSHGEPIDRRGPLTDVHTEPLTRRPINAMDRDPVRRPLDTGVRAINAMLTVGRGQRIGLFAGTGVGKSVLMGMMARYTEADVIVVGLIGERGREVKEFIEDILGDEGLARSVVVAAPADAPPLTRMRGAQYATAIAEHFRDAGRHVLLLMDSLTRYAMAQREIALAIGEPPATKGYPPSCFARLPELVERSGNGRNANADGGGGSITAFYTVLTEGDDPQDPIADAARGILDGHIVLSRELAEAGHYPAIDVERSISRVMNAVAAPRHVESARRFRQLHARHQRARDLIQLGAYAPGHDAELDAAVRLAAPMATLLQQDMRQSATLAGSIDQLVALLASG